MLNYTRNRFNIKGNRNISTKFFHILYMDDIKQYAASKKQINDLPKITRAFSTDIHKDFGLEKCKILHIVRKKILNGHTELHNGDKS